MAQADFLFNIVSTSGVPIYRQLMDQITAMIAAGNLKPGIFLPSIREVGKTLEINPMTVSKVYSILERDGVLENVRGQGMRIIKKSPNRASPKEKRDMITPALKQVVLTAHQLQLDKNDVLGMLDNLWKE
ncbi:MAG: GntR family transcriptional regulator [Candidatus Omnitrophota bacterium]